MEVGQLSGRPWQARATRFAPPMFFLLFSLWVLYTFRQPPALSDQLLYFSQAAALPDIEPNHQNLRIGLLWPVRAAIEAFGYSELAYYLLPWVTALTLGLATWWLGSTLFDRRVGWVAAVLILLIPGYVNEVSYLLPDYFAAALATLSVTLLFRAGRKGTAPRTQPLALFGSGFLLGWAYLVREYVVVLFPTMMMALLLLRVSPRGWLAFWGGALICYAAELLWGLFAFGDPLLRFSATASPRETSQPFTMDVKEILLQFPAVFAQLPGGELLSAFMVLGLLCCFTGLTTKRIEWRVLAAWGGVTWLFFTAVALLPLLLDNHAVLLRMQKFRYWALLFPPVLLAGAATAFRAGEVLGRRSKGLEWTLAILVLAFPAAGIARGLRELWAAPAMVQNDNRDYVEFRKFMRNAPELPSVLWMDAGRLGSNVSLPIYFTNFAGSRSYWNGQVRYLNVVGQGWRDISDINEGFVVMDRTRSRDNVNRGAPPYYATPHRYWEVVFRSRHGRIIVLDARRRLR